MGVKRIKAFLLAAGLGSRLRPITATTPKPLVPVARVPAIFYALASLRRFGVREIGINLHHLPERIPQRLGEGRALGFSFRYFREKRLLGTGGALRNAADFLGDAPFVLMNADTILELDLRALAEAHRRNAGIATLAVSPAASVDRFGGLACDDGGRIRGLVRAGEATPSNLAAAVYAGAGMLDPEILNDLERGGETPCLIRDGLLPALARGKKAFAFECRGFFSDLGTVESLRETERRIAAGGAAQLRREAAALYFALDSSEESGGAGISSTIE